MSIAAPGLNSAVFGRRCLTPLGFALLLCSAAAFLVAGCSGSAGKSGKTAKSESAAPAAASTGESAKAGKTVATSDAAASNSADDAPVVAPSAVDLQLQEDLIRAVVDNFNRLDEFEPDQIFPQMRDRLNQWMFQLRPGGSWQRDALLDTLDPPLKSAPLVAYFIKNLETGLFTINDMIGLQEAIWIRDIARTARGGQLDDLSIAEQLFDWTVRNLQLVEDPPAGTPPVEHSPAEILLLGRATARERAWIFLLLLRQQGLDGVVLAIPGEGAAKDNGKDGDKNASSKGGASDASGRDGSPREWVVALVTDEDLFLFDPALGMPLPGPPGHRVATLADVAADDGMLRSLDLSSTRPYPVKAEQLAHLVAYVEGSPVCLSRRMEALEGRLTGEQRVTLSAHPQRLAERLASRPGIETVRYWSLPYEYWRARGALRPGQPPQAAADLLVFQAMPPLIKGRSLQFKGAFEGDRGAMAYYLKSRLSKQRIATAPPAQQKILETAKQDASYWLGVIAFEQKNYPVAVDYFSRRTLEATPDGPWTDGAHYNLGRTYEALGQLPEAIELYQSDRSPQKHGNRLRARRLKAQSAAGEPAEEKP